MQTDLWVAPMRRTPLSSNWQHLGVHFRHPKKFGNFLIKMTGTAAEDRRPILPAVDAADALFGVALLLRRRRRRSGPSTLRAMLKRSRRIGTSVSDIEVGQSLSVPAPRAGLARRLVRNVDKDRPLAEIAEIGSPVLRPEA